MILTKEEVDHLWDLTLKTQPRYTAFAALLNDKVIEKIKSQEPAAFIRKESVRSGNFVRKLVWNSTPQSNYSWCVGHEPLYRLPEDAE